MMRNSHAPVLGVVLLFAFGGALPGFGQQILLDKPVRAGELTLFPDLGDGNVYYYVSDKPHLAATEDGQPQFSFLRYVENVRTGADQPEAREGEGGGIFHAVVALDVTEDQIREAQRDLQRTKPGARIQGPVVYRSGKFGLVSSFIDPKGNLSTQVVGLGSAPVLDGQKAAVSIQLTKLGSKVLWESFHTATPDISFTFEMDVQGLRSPKRALIEANFDQIYDHKAFAVGAATPFLAAEIKGAFDDLRREGAIKVTTIGTDERLEPLITTAYNKLTEMMFAPLGGTGTPGLDSLMAGAGQPSVLDKAMTMLREGRAATKAENERIRAENEAAEKREAAAAAAGATPAAGGAGATGGVATPAGGGGTAAAGTGGTAPPAGGGTAAAGTGGTSAAGSTQASAETAAGGARPKPYSEQAPRTGGEQTKKATPADPPNAKPQPRKEEVSQPYFAAVAMFEMKKIHQSGSFRIDLNKYTTDNITMRFDENIGDLRSYLDDAGYFRQVNLDDPLYRQRELVCFVDGLNAQDFGQFVNFVTVHMRKTHQSGEITDDEVRIDRNNFNKEGNNFKLLYGWKGDNDRRRWFDYECQTTWSFFGGKTVEEPWRKLTQGAVNLVPPYLKRSVELQAEAERLSASQVRLVTVQIHYDLGGAEQVAQGTLSPGKGELSQKIDFMLPAGALEYGYEITWRLAGNKTVTSGPQRSSEAVLFVDELPGA